MLQQQYHSIRKIKREKAGFDLFNEERNTESDDVRNMFIGNCNFIEVKFSSEEREQIKDYLGVIKAIYKYLYRSNKLISLAPNKEELLGDTYETYLSEWKEVYLKWRMVFWHYRNCLKIPNGLYGYIGITHSKSLIEVNKGERWEGYFHQYNHTNSYNKIIKLPYDANDFSRLALWMKESENKLENFRKTMNKIEIYHPRFLLYQKDIEKYIFPIPYSRLVDSEVYLYRIINYINPHSKIYYSW